MTDYAHSTYCYKLFCCESCCRGLFIDCNCATCIVIFLPFAFLSSGCHIHFQEFRNEMCDIPISGIFFLTKRMLIMVYNVNYTLYFRVTCTMQ